MPITFVHGRPKVANNRFRFSSRQNGKTRELREPVGTIDHFQFQRADEPRNQGANRNRIATASLRAASRSRKYLRVIFTRNYRLLLDKYSAA